MNKSIESLRLRHLKRVSGSILGTHRIIIEEHLSGLDKFQRKRSTLRELVSAVKSRSDAAVDYGYFIASNINSKILIEGPFKGTYSLSIVNRRFAEAAHSSSIFSLATTSRNEAISGDNYCATSKVLLKTYAPERVPEADLVLFNNWPPTTKHLKGKLNGLFCFAWEETEFPMHYANEFNNHLSFACVTSSFVRDALVNSGVAVPIFVCGNGITISNEFGSNRQAPSIEKDKQLGGDTFTFLHISSGFPRKGVDVLIEAFCQEFKRGEPVRLVIKSFENPHNNIKQLLYDKRSQLNGCADIALILGEISPKELDDLYRSADAVVYPSRGEGFLLPAAEAAMHGLPVLTTNFGGQTDFCNKENSILISGRLTRSSSHVRTETSMWLEPDICSLRKAMRRVTQMTSVDREEYAKRLRTEIESKYAWDSVWKRTILAANRSTTVRQWEKTGCKVLLLSSWDQKCGIATYSDLLVSHISQPSIDISLIAHVSPGFEESKYDPRISQITRVWNHTEDGLKLTIEAIKNTVSDILLIQHHLGHYSYDDLCKFISAAHSSGKYTILELHSSTKDYPFTAMQSEQLSKCWRVIVHTIEEAATARELCPEIRVALITHPIRSIQRCKDNAGQQTNLMQSSAPKKTYVVGMFGFAMPHKGIDSALRAINHIKKSGRTERYKIKLMCACNGSDKTTRHIEEIQNLIGELGIAPDVDLDTKFHRIEYVHQELSDADCIVFPYEENSESASGAIREVVGLGKPIIVSDVSIFDEFREIAWTADVKDASELAETIVSACTSGDEVRRERLEKQDKYIEKNSWDARSLQYQSIIIAAMDERSCHMDLVTTVPTMSPSNLLTHGEYYFLPTKSNETRSGSPKMRITYFLHPPRTAGSSMIKNMLNSIPNQCSYSESGNNIYWECIEDNQINTIRFGLISVDDILRSCNAEDPLQTDLALITILRDPVKRCASNLVFWWNEMNETPEKFSYYMHCGISWSKDPIEFARSNLMAAIERGTVASRKYSELINPYTHQFSSNLYSRRANSDFEALIVAQENLRRFDCIEFFDELPKAHDNILGYVVKRHKLILKPGTPTKQEHERVGVSQVLFSMLNDNGIVAMINEISKCDTAVYRYCLSGLWK